MYSMDKRVFVILLLICGCIQQENEIGITDLEEDLACIFPFDAPEEMIITSQKEFEMLMEHVSDNPTCVGFVLPEIEYYEVVFGVCLA